MDRIHVIWLDSRRVIEPLVESEAKQQQAQLVETVGFLVNGEDDVVIIARDFWQEDQTKVFRDIIVIPKSFIRSQVLLDARV